jgi:hypothetical protein
LEKKHYFLFVTNKPAPFRSAKPFLCFGKEAREVGERECCELQNKQTIIKIITRPTHCDGWKEVKAMEKGAIPCAAFLWHFDFLRALFCVQTDFCLENLEIQSFF